MGKETISVVDRYRGCLVGVAVGDALGGPLEFAPEKPTGVVSDMLPNPFGYWKVGEYTDDTVQTLLMTDSFIANNGYNPDDFVKRLIKWFDNGEAKGLGNTTRISLSLINEGIHWKEAGKEALNKGAVPANGSLMRTAPVGLLFRTDPKSIRKVAAELSSITHSASQCIEVCQMASQLVAYLACGKPKDTAIDTIKREYRDAFHNAIDSLPEHEKHPGGAYVTFAIALTSFKEATSLEEAIVQAVNRGGDTDTQAAVTGAFAGAYWGVAQIPKRWTEKLNPLSASDVAKKASNLFDVSEKYAL